MDCPKSLRRPFLDKTRRMAEEFLQNHPEASSEEVADYLGEPQELAQGFLETLDQEVLQRYRKRKKFFLYGCIAVLVIVVICISIWGIKLMQRPISVEVIDVITIHD